MDTQNNSDLQRFASELVSSTRDYVYIRPQDGLFIMRPNRLHHLNETATFMLDLLYGQEEGPDVEAVVTAVVQRYHADEQDVRRDMRNLLVSVAALLNNDVCGAPSVKRMPFGSHQRDLPVLSEIALTYKCQNHCTFCYADSPARGLQVPEMTTDEVQTIIDRIFDEANCPTVSFTGGEPTLRQDVPELAGYA